MPHFTPYLNEHDIVYILKQMHELDDPDRWAVSFKDEEWRAARPFYDILITLEGCKFDNYDGLVVLEWGYNDTRGLFSNEVTVVERKEVDGYQKRYATDIIFYERENIDVVIDISKYIITMKKLTNSVEYKTWVLKSSNTRQ